MELTDSIKVLKGIGDAKAKYFERLGIYTVGQLLAHFPRTYEDRTEITDISMLRPNTPCCIRATVCAPVSTARGKSGVSFAKSRASDDTGSVNLTFFNAPYLRDSLIRGETYVFFGKPQLSGRTFTLINPVFEREERSGMSDTSATGRIMPVYPLTAGLTNYAVARAVSSALDTYIGDIPDCLPEDVRRTHNLCHLAFAYRQVHFPSDMYSQAIASRRFAFEEMFLLSIGLSRLRNRRDGTVSAPLADTDISEFISSLPFTLTNGQRKCIDDALFDMSDKGGLKPPMRRLIQGDVGSGKTMVAAACAFAVAKNGGQSVLMAPTEILATQHYNSLAPMFSQFGFETVLLTGSLRAAERRRVVSLISSGEAKLVIATHAVLNDSVTFPNLRLVIADEQHRFGVRQRGALSAKGENVHMLVMSATPIPRTLALMIYGDLDVSVLNELPPGRIPVYTRYVKEEKRHTIYEFMGRLFASGKQAYVVCPLIEDNEGGNNLKAVEAYAKDLSETIFRGFRVEYLHGKMNEKQKKECMERFKSGETQLLVSTTVIEVGVDVPNAVMMVIENAERFGLSQLHQLRGRVGRGRERAYCVLFSENESEDTQKRLSVMEETTDGFVIAQRDLELRGPGEFFGERQSGASMSKIAFLGADMRLLTDAQSEARRILATDPKLTKYPHLKARVARMFEEAGDVFS